MAETSKHTILQALRGRAWPATELPPALRRGIEYADPRQQFCDSLKGVGGNAVLLTGEDQLPAALDNLDVYRSARKICSTIPGLPRANVTAAAIDDPHHFADVDLFVARGEFAVAENGAVWITDAGLRHRVLFFLAQHLALVVPAAAIVSNMHQAYERLSFVEPRFGAFISGPSKTADIEQSLVIGAHGARSLTVFLVGKTNGS